VGIVGYVKINWTEETPITAARLNLMETQYDEFDTSYTVHNHDDRYYTQAESDARFFHVGNDGEGSGLDAWLLDDLSPAGIEAAAIPQGGIGLWSGSLESIPEGFLICNGMNGTPDLRDRFVVGAGNAYARGAVGGFAARTPTGTLTIAPHALTANEIPEHVHQMSDVGPTTTAFREMGSNGAASGITYISTYTEYIGGTAHDHPGSTITFGAYDNRPPYRALFWIMRRLS